MAEDPSTSSQLPPSNLAVENLPGGNLLGDYFNICVPLYGALLNGNWEAAEVILNNHPELIRSAITDHYDTPLHVAASAGDTKLTERLLYKLVESMTADDLQLRNNSGDTAFGLAAAVGNIKILEMMATKNSNLQAITGFEGRTPLHMSALNGKYETVKYLYQLSKNMSGWPSEHQDWVLQACVESDFFDVALLIVRDHPENQNAIGSVLGVLAGKPHAFNGLVEHKLLMKIIKSIRRLTHMEGGPAEMHGDALKLLTSICENFIKKMPKLAVEKMLKGPADQIPQTDGEQKYSSRTLFVAAEKGNTRFVMELLGAYPDLISSLDDDKRTIFHIALMHRHQDILNLLYVIGSRIDHITLSKDEDGNNMLHLVGKTIRVKMAKTSGASLLMQQELWWFKKVEKMIPPAHRGRKNNAGQLPDEIFVENNKILVVESLKWVKECMVVAALLITVSFGVALAVPGGYHQSTGFPVFIQEPIFFVFVIANAFSLFSSSTSLLVYLSILGSRYEIYDSLFSLTRKLIIGLTTLFFAVSAMMVTFCASFCMLYHNGSKWVPILIATFAIMPLAAFATMEFRLLADMISAIRRPSIQPNSRSPHLLQHFLGVLPRYMQALQHFPGVVANVFQHLK